MNEIELTAAAAWKEKHKVECPDGHINVVFHPTPIGVAYEVVCSCGKKENVTDFDCW